MAATGVQSSPFSTKTFGKDSYHRHGIWGGPLFSINSTPVGPELFVLLVVRFHVTLLLHSEAGKVRTWHFVFFCVSCFTARVHLLIKPR